MLLQGCILVRGIYDGKALTDFFFIIVLWTSSQLLSSSLFGHFTLNATVIITFKGFGSTPSHVRMINRLFRQGASWKIGTQTGISEGKGIDRSGEASEQRPDQFALVARKGIFHLVDHPPPSKLGVEPHNAEVGVHYSHTRATNADSVGGSSQATAVEPWHEVKVDTNRFSAHAFKIPQEKIQKPGSGIRARMRQTTRGILIRIAQKLGEGVEAVADIQLYPVETPVAKGFEEVTDTQLYCPVETPEGTGLPEPREPKHPWTHIAELDGHGLDTYVSLPQLSTSERLVAATTSSDTLAGIPSDTPMLPASTPSPSTPLTRPESDPNSIRGTCGPSSYCFGEPFDLPQESVIVPAAPGGGPQHHRISTAPLITRGRLVDFPHQPEPNDSIARGDPDGSEGLRCQRQRQAPSALSGEPTSPPNPVVTSPPSPNFSFASEEPDYLIGQLEERSARNVTLGPKHKSRRRPPPATSEEVVADRSPSDRQVYRETPRAIDNLAEAYRNLGRWTEAETWKLEALEGSRKRPEETYSDKLDMMAHLAITYQNQGWWSEAEDLELKVLEGRKKALGETHPSTLSVMADLTETYWNQGRRGEAEALGEGVLAGCKEAFGEAHPFTLRVMANLAVTYWNRLRTQEAEALEVGVLEGCKKILGETHPDTLRAMANRLVTYRNQGRLEEAEGLELELLETRNKGLGEATASPESWTQRRPTPKICKVDVDTDEGGPSDTTSTEKPPAFDITRQGDLDHAAVDELLSVWDARRDRSHNYAEANERTSSNIRTPSISNTKTDNRSPRQEISIAAQNTESGDLQRSETRSPISSSGVLTSSIVIHRRLNKWIEATAYDCDGHDWTLGNDFDTSGLEVAQLELPFSDTRMTVDHTSGSVDLDSPVSLNQWTGSPHSGSGLVSSLESLHSSGGMIAAQDTLPQRSNATERLQETLDILARDFPTITVLGISPPEGGISMQTAGGSQSTVVPPSRAIDTMDLLALPAETPTLTHHSIEESNPVELSVEPNISYLDIDRSSRILPSTGSDSELEQTIDVRTHAHRLRDPIFNYIRLISIAALTSLFQLAQQFSHRQRLRLRVPTGYVRIRWRCKCGQQLFDDFVERRPGAAKDLEEHLNRHSPNQTVSSDGSGSASSSSSASRADSRSTDPSGQTSLSSISSSDIGLSGASRYSPVIEARGQPAIVPLSEPRWLLTCASGERYNTRLHHVDVNAILIKSDKDLAMRLKQQYLQLRAPWHQALRLRGLTTIQFVQFEVHRSRAVDIRKCPDMPPPSAANYIFEPSDLLPPVGENYLMHLFHHPQDYDDEYITYVRLPKKCGSRLRVLQNRDVEIGWGINLVEGFQPARVWAVAVAFFVTGSLVFGIAWAAKRGDVSGAFGVSAWMCMLPVLLVGLVQAYWE